MDQLYQAVFWVPFLITAVFIFYILRRELFGQTVKLSTAKKVTLAVVGLFVLQAIAKGLVFYQLSRKNNLGQYLLQQKGYLWRNFLYIGQSYLQNLIIAIIFTLAAVLVYKLSRRPIFNKVDLWLIFLATFVAGYPSAIILVLATLIVMVLTMVLFVRGKEKRLSLTPYLLIGALVVGLLNGFQFYANFLHLIGLL